MNFKNLTSDNYVMYAMKYYDNPGCYDVSEFHDDLNRIKYIKRLFRRYKNKKTIDSLKLRLVLNHIVIVYNVFSVEAATRLLFLKIEKDLWYILKTFLEFLKYMPDIVLGINDDDILSSNIGIDKLIEIELSQI